MKIQKFKKAAKKIKTTQLKLQNCGDGSVDVVIVDEEGNVLDDGFVLNIGGEGVKLYEGVNSKHVKTEDGYIKTFKD